MPRSGHSRHVYGLDEIEGLSKQMVVDRQSQPQKNQTEPTEGSGLT